MIIIYSYFDTWNFFYDHNFSVISIPRGIEEWTNEWRNEGMNESMDKLMKEWINEGMNELMNY